MENVDLEALLAEQKVMVEEMEKVKKEFQDKGKAILKKSFSAFFEAVPSIKAIPWTQYTPYFNDGEPCEFGVRDMWVLSELSYSDWQEEGGSYAEEYDVVNTYCDDKYKNELTKEQKKLANDFIKNISKLSDDIYEDMFGDHVYVIATKDGFEIEEYSHD